jgi:hypothetical protein
MKPYTWRAAILKSDLPPTTRHVLLTLSCYINDVGQSAYPSTKTLTADTGLSERSVITHLQLAKERGWLKVAKHGFGGQKWAHHEYFPCCPEVDYDEIPAEKGTEPPSAAPEKALNVVPKALNLLPKGTEPNDKKALKEVQSNSPVELSKELSNKSNKATALAAPTLPDWLPEKSWNEWVEYRASIKAPLTAKAAELSIKKLAKLYAEGNDPVDVIDQSIFSGKWTDLYPIKNDRQQQPQQPHRQPSAYQKKQEREQAFIDRLQGKPNANRIVDIN